MNMISIVGVGNSSERSRIEVDEYVPIRFRAYEGALGAKYLRIGNFKGSMLECLLDPNTLTIRGFTLTAFDAVHTPKYIPNLPRAAGLPVAYVDEFKGPIFGQTSDVRSEFSVGFGTDFIEIDLGLDDAQSIVVSGPVEFYLGAGSLAGIRVNGLKPREISILNELHTV